MTRAPRKPRKPAGTVSLVGAGPGDPDLLTVRAVEVLSRADVVVGPAERFAAVLARHCEGAEVVDTTDLPSGEDPAKTIVAHAREGRQVVRLYQGDPFVACGGPALGAALTKAKLPWQVVPGLSAAFAVPAYAGVPPLDRSAGSVTVVDLCAGEPDWSALAAGTGTLVLMMLEADGVAKVATALTAAGMPGSTPAAATVAGSLPEQRTAAGSLETIGDVIAEAELAGPATLVVGAAVRQRDRLSWFESRPLAGWKVLVPRTKEQAGQVAEQLRGYGAVPMEVPTIAVEPPRTPQQMERAVRGLVQGRYQWVVFTSTNAWRAVRERLEEYGLDARAFAGIKIACIGDVTAEAVRGYGIQPDLVPSGEQSSEGLLADWPPYDDVLDPIDRVLLPRADIATETLVAGLKELGWEVDDVTAYRTVRAAPPPAETREAIKTGGFDAVLFTSSSTVRNLVGIAGKPHEATVIACIGPRTSETAEEHGLTVHVKAPRPSVTELVDALAAYADELRAQAEADGLPFRPTERLARARQRKKPPARKPPAGTPTGSKRASGS
ncbi:MAG: uroporphyrinogen-III synthase [Frankiaceae bacterium]